MHKRFSKELGGAIPDFGLMHVSQRVSGVQVGGQVEEATSDELPDRRREQLYVVVL